jgi:hypothetical protein
MKIGWAIGGVVALMAVLGACGGEPAATSAGPRTSTSPTSSTTVTTAPTGSAAATPTGSSSTTAGGIVALITSDVTFGASSADVSVIDPQTGVASTTRHFEPTTVGITIDTSYRLFNGNYPISARALISPDLTKMVAKIATAANGNGTNHVGWVDQNGKVTDVTAMLPTSSGFSTVMVTGIPSFDSDGTFWFVSMPARQDDSSPYDSSGRTLYKLRQGSTTPEKITTTAVENYGSPGMSVGHAGARS